MRILLGWLVLLALFVSASTIHDSFTEAVRRQRGLEVLRREAAKDPTFETWGKARILIGRPSEAEPFELPEDPRSSSPDAPPGTSSDPSLPAGWLPPVYEMTVQPGQVLSVICEGFYGTAKPPLPDLVANYNGLSSANNVRAGQTLRLPPRQVLESDER